MLRSLLLVPPIVCLAAAFGHAALPAAEPALPGYADHAAFRRQLHDIAESRFARVQSLARTAGGREVLLLRVGAGEPDAKPAVLFLGAAVPSHLVGSELAVRMARDLVARAEEGDDEVRELLRRITIYFVPRPSPDACEAFFQRPYRERDTNGRPVDDDRDGRIDEDGCEDLNGDGQITMIRVEDPSGPWVADKEDPRVLVEADAAKNQQGRWSLYTEGRDNDEDGLLNEDPPGGVALNRNFPFRYPFFQPGAGPHQVSEPETRALADFALARRNIALVLSFGPEDNLLHPWKPDGDVEKQEVKNSALPDDAPVFDFLADAYQEIRQAKDSPPPGKGEGAWSTWAYFHYGRWSLSARAWWVPESESVPPDDGTESPADAGEPESADTESRATDGDGKRDDDAERDGDRGASDREALKWLAAHGIEAFVAWTPIEHSDFPNRKVEVGGFRPFVRSNPPADRLDALAEKHVEYLLRVGQLMPRLAVHEVKAESLGAGIYRMTVVVLNEGYLPTFPRMGEISRQPQPVQLALDLPKGAQVLNGPSRVRVPTLAGRGGRHEHVFLVRLRREKPTTVPIRVWAPAVGHVTRQVELRPQ